MRNLLCKFCVHACFCSICFIHDELVKWIAHSRYMLHDDSIGVLDWVFWAFRNFELVEGDEVVAAVT